MHLRYGNTRRVEEVLATVVVIFLAWLVCWVAKLGYQLDTSHMTLLEKLLIDIGCPVLVVSIWAVLILIYVDYLKSNRN